MAFIILVEICVYLWYAGLINQLSKGVFVRPRNIWNSLHRTKVFSFYAYNYCSIMTMHFIVALSFRSADANDPFDACTFTQFQSANLLTPTFCILCDLRCVTLYFHFSLGNFFSSIFYGLWLNTIKALIFSLSNDSKGVSQEICIHMTVARNFIVWG